MAFFSKRAKPVDVPVPGFSAPNAGEWQLMAGHREFLAGQGVDISDAASIASGYDTLFSLWAAAPEGSKPDPNMLINIVGTALGEHLVNSTTMEWVVATDEYGTELAVRNAANELLIYPANMVAKRWSAGETGELIPTLIAEVASHVQA